MPTVTMPDGVVVDMPDDPTPEQVTRLKALQNPSPKVTEPTDHGKTSQQWSDLAPSYPSLVNGVDNVMKAAAWPGEKLGGKLGDAAIESGQKEGLSPNVNAARATVEDLGTQYLTGAGEFKLAKTVGGMLAKGLGKVGDVIGDFGKKFTGEKSEKATEDVKNSVMDAATKASDILKKQSQALATGRRPEVASQKALTEASAAVLDKNRAALKISEQRHGQSLKELSSNAVSDEAAGAHIQQHGLKNMAKIKADADKVISDIKDPAFERARQRAASGDLPSTNPKSKPILDAAIADIEQQIADTPVAMREGLQKRIKSLIGGESELPAGEQMVEQLRATSMPGYVAKTSKDEGVTLHQLEFLRRWSKDPILRKDTGFGALDATRMAKTGDKIRAAMEAYEPDVGRYINSYKDVMKGKEAALGGRVGTSATNVAAETADAEIFNQKPQQVAATFLDGTSNSAKKLVALVGGKTPELVSVVKGNIRHKIESMTAEQAQKWVAKNDGMLSEFPEAKSVVDKVVKGKADSERITSLVKKSSDRVIEKSKESQSVKAGVIKSAEPVKEASSKLNRRLSEIDKAPPEEVVKLAEGTLKDLFDNGHIDEAAYQNFKGKIRNAIAQNKDREAARKAVRFILGTAGAYGLYQGGHHAGVLP